MTDCRCPEILTPQGWRPFCELGPGVADDPQQYHEPIGWRCPWCRGAVAQVWSEQTAASEPSGRVPEALVEEVPAVRAGYRCLSARCEWSAWVMWHLRHEGRRRAGLQ